MQKRYCDTVAVILFYSYNLKDFSRKWIYHNWCDVCADYDVICEWGRKCKIVAINHVRV